MELQSTENGCFGFSSDGNLRHSALSTEETNNRTRYDFNLSESFYEIDVAGLDMTMYPDEDFKKLLQDIQTIGQSTDSCDSSITDVIDEFLLGSGGDSHSTESNDMADQIQSTEEQLAMIKSNSSALPVIRSHIEKLPMKLFNDQSISLSKSVAVMVPVTDQLQLVYPLEESYRPRYKSDYFPQKGSSRRPRYVADSERHHFITLQMPTEYQCDLTSEYLRVALITTSDGSRGHFYSPYKFQTDHYNVKVPDCNPIYLPVQSLCKNSSDLKLQLVLIKSKLDQLSEAQPLKPFFDTPGSVKNIIPEKRLAPKDLISNYQLDKSQIAFTLCTKLPDGTYDIHSETTVISSVVTEVMTKQASGAKKNADEATSANSGKQVCCPNCAHFFDPLEAKSTKTVNKRKAHVSESQTTFKSSTGNVMIKKKKTA